METNAKVKRVEKRKGERERRVFIRYYWAHYYSYFIEFIEHISIARYIILLILQGKKQAQKGEIHCLQLQREYILYTV